MLTKCELFTVGRAGRALAAFAGASVIAGALLLGPQASAATFSQSFVAPVADFPNPLATSSIGAIVENVSGSELDGTPPDYRSPWDTTLNPDGVYSGVSARSSATYALGAEFSGLNIMWGSVDEFNTLEFYLGAVLVDTLSGVALIADGAPEGLGFSVVSILTVGLFDTIVFTSADDSFEYANLAAIPIPPALPLFGTGLLALIYLRRRSRRRAEGIAA